MGKSFKWDGEKAVEVDDQEPVYVWDGEKAVKKEPLKKKEVSGEVSPISSTAGQPDFVTEGGIKGWAATPERQKLVSQPAGQPIAKNAVASSTATKKPEVNQLLEEEKRVEKINNEVGYAKKAIEKGRTLEDMAALFLAQQDEKFGSQFQALRQTNLSKDAPITQAAEPYNLPANNLFGEGTMGKIMKNAFSNPQFIKVVREKPELYQQFKQEQSNFLGKYPEAAKVYLSTILSEELDEMGAANNLIEVTTKKEFDEIVKSAKAKGKITPQEEFFLNKEVRPSMGYKNFFRSIVGKPAIKTPDFVTNALSGAVQGSRNLGQGITEETGIRSL